MDNNKKRQFLQPIGKLLKLTPTPTPTKQELALLCLCVSQGFETLDEFIDTMTENDRLINLEACAMLCKNHTENELKEKIALHLKK